MIYDDIKYNKDIIRETIPQITIHFVDGVFVEIVNGPSDKEYKIKMSHDNILHYETIIKSGMWSKSGIKYYKDWNIKIFDNSNDNLILEHSFNANNKRVYISFDSSSIGDTFAWIPYVEIFREKHNCKLIVSTFHNDLFKDQYPEIEFVRPGEVVNSLYAMYKIGWYYDGDNFRYSQNPRDFKKLPLQQTICDIIGLDYVELYPKLKLSNNQKKKKVGIGLHSTAQSKYWNNPSGWQEVVDYLKKLKYEVMIYSKENNGYMGNFHPNGVEKFKGGSLQEVINDIETCEFFIGLGSGLTWLAWACKLPIVLISGFSKPYSETKMNTYRVINESVCNGCFNTHKLDAGDWNWCPLYKGTDRQFECTKQISSDMVIDQINKLLKIASV